MENGGRLKKGSAFDVKMNKWHSPNMMKIQHKDQNLITQGRKSMNLDDKFQPRQSREKIRERDKENEVGGTASLQCNYSKCCGRMMHNGSQSWKAFILEREERRR